MSTDLANTIFNQFQKRILRRCKSAAFLNFIKDQNDVDDLCQSILTVLWTLCLRFDPKINPNFLAYANPIIEKSINTNIYKINKQKSDHNSLISANSIQDRDQNEYEED